MFCSRKIKTLCCLKVAAAFMSLFFFFSSFGTLFQIQSEFTGISGLLLATIEFSIWWKILHPFLPGSFCRTRWLLEDSALNSPPKFLIFFFFYVYTAVKFVLPVMVEGLVNQMFCHHKKSSDGYTKEVTTWM